MKRLLAITLGVALAGVGTVALAARNASGTHTLPSGNPVVAGTRITSAWANALTADLSAEVTDSLSRSGKGGMTAPLRGVDGSVTAPGLSFTGETDSGLYRASAGNVRLAVDGADSLQCTATGVTVPGTLAVTGAGTVGGTLGVTGAATLSAGATVSSGDVSLTQAALQGIRKTGGNLQVGTEGATDLVLYTNGVTRFTVGSAGALTSNGGTVTGLPTPSAASDAATKGYVDTALAGYTALAAQPVVSNVSATGVLSASWGRTVSGLTYAQTGAGVYTVTRASGIFPSALVAFAHAVDGAAPSIAIAGAGTGTLTITMGDAANHPFALSFYLP